MVKVAEKKTTTKKTAHAETETQVVVKKTKKAKADTAPVEAAETPALAQAFEKAVGKKAEAAVPVAAPVAPVAPVAAAAPAVAEPRQPKKDKFGRSQAVGKKKNAIARVFIKLGKGKVVVNGRAMKDYFPRPVLQMIINQPFAVTNREGQYDVLCTMRGGGLSGQAYALRHGISRCLDLFEPELHSALKHAGFLTRDSRIVERKKPGLSKARKRFQFSKR